MAELSEKLAELVGEGSDVDPGEAAGGVEDAEARLEEIGTRLAALRPPEGGVGARRRLQEGRGDPYQGAGSAYREAAEAGDAAKLAELSREREELLEERALLQRQRQALRGLARRARDRLERETAPDRLADALEGFPELLEAAEDALAAFREAREALEDAGSEILSCRKLLGEDAPGLEPEELRRWGLLSARIPGEVGEVEVEGAPDVRPRRRRHLFRTPALQRQRMEALAPPREALVEAVRRRLREERDRKVRHMGTPPEIPESRIREAVEDVRRRMIVDGEELELPEAAEAAS